MPSEKFSASPRLESGLIDANRLNDSSFDRGLTADSTDRSLREITSPEFGISYVESRFSNLLRPGACFDNGCRWIITIYAKPQLWSRILAAYFSW